MYYVQYGGKRGQKHALEESENLVAVRTVTRQVSLGSPAEGAALKPASREVLTLQRYFLARLRAH